MVFAGLPNALDGLDAVGRVHRAAQRITSVRGIGQHAPGAQNIRTLANKPALGSRRMNLNPDSHGRMIAGLLEQLLN